MEGNEGSYLPNCQTNLDIACIVCHFINTTAYHLGLYKTSSPTTKELHGQTNLVMVVHVLPLLFWHLINTTFYHKGWFKTSSPISCHTPSSSLRWSLNKKRNFISKISHQIQQAVLYFVILKTQHLMWVWPNRTFISFYKRAS